VSQLVPNPPTDLSKRANFTSWPPTTPLFRCHDYALEGQVFNPRFGNGGRFHWFDNDGGERVPVLYAADCYEGAIAETILRDVPLEGRRTLYRKDYRGRAITELHLDPAATLSLVQLHDPGLLRLGVRPRNLTETNSYHYQRTKKWAHAVYCQLPRAQGLVWVSGRFNTAHAVVLFGDRVDDGLLHTIPDGTQLVDSGEGLARLVKLGKDVGITVARPIPRP
jgi:hypothetical protein